MQKRQKNKGQLPAGQNKNKQPLSVLMTETAAATYERFFIRAQKALERGEKDSPHVKTLRLIDEAIETIIPHAPFDKKHALVGTLRPIFRLHKGRLRICWVGSSERNEVHIIFISETLRKEGDANDPYEVLSRQVKNGIFDSVFRHLGVKSPLRQQSDMIQ